MHPERKQLKEFITYRMSHHVSDWTFWLYLFFIICGVGAAGIWINIYLFIVNGDTEIITRDLPIAVYTFFPSVLVASCADILLPDKVMRPIKMLSICLIISALGLMAFCVNLSPVPSLICGLFGCFLGILTWIIAHGEDPVFDDAPPSAPNLPMGGETTKPVQGDLGEFNV